MRPHNGILNVAAAAAAAADVAGRCGSSLYDDVVRLGAHCNNGGDKEE
jgi:hypothetical protein